MRRIILSVGISLDGYIARPDGAVDFLFMPKDFSMADFFSGIDTAILGRKTFDVALRLGLPASSMKYYVLSRSRPPGERDGASFVKQSPAALIRQLRKRPGKNIWLMGGADLARQFLDADLVDELHLGVVPTLLGEGIPLFAGGFPQRDFKLVENKTYSRGLVGLKYKRARRLSPKPGCD